MPQIASVVTKSGFIVVGVLGFVSRKFSNRSFQNYSTTDVINDADNYQLKPH